MRGRAATARRPLAIAIGAGAVGGLLLIAQAWCLAQIVDRVTIRGEDLSGLWPWLLALLGLFLLRAVAVGGVEVASSAAAARVKRALRAALFERIAALGPVWMQGQRSGEVANTLVDGVEEIEKYYASYLPQMALTVFIPLAILIAVFPADWVSGLIFAVTAPLIPVFMIIIGKGAESLNQRQWQRLARMSAHFFDVIEGLTTLKLFNASRREADVIARMSDAYRQSTMSVLRVAFLSSLVLEFFATLSIALAAVYIGFRLYYHQMDFLPGFFALLLAPEFYRPLRDMGAQYHARMDAIAAAEGLIGCFTAPLPKAPRALRQLPGGVVRRIEFDNVSFRHGGDGDGVSGISFSLARGECVALMGASGAGKTTVGQLLLRFLTPASGLIRINGEDLRLLDEADWMRRVAWMPQSPTLFYGSVIDNIRLGAPEASFAEVEAAAEAAQAADFIARLPQGYETQLGDAGQGLSGGEIQRIALARLFLKRAEVMVLDEATAALDRATARRVLQSVARATAESAVLFIAHDLDAARMADRILVVEHGRVVESGSHAALVASGGLYAGMAALNREEAV
ncbi:MAG TPA: thiol reductant ABC exporter subunit CydD [Devosiaceae bacterium]|nr:thiol reductant ABC exporter subunit CydD [Devosiaceae bacterium]